MTGMILGKLMVDYDYLTDLYSENDINKLHLRIIHMIEQIVKDPEITLEDIEVLTQDEKNTIINVFNNRVLDYPKDKSIIDLFEEQVRQNPSNICLVYKDTSFTYSDLNKFVNKFARFLKQNGIIKNDIVGVYMSKRPWFIISILAIQKLGAAYLPMHPDYPEDRVNYILSDSNCKILITDQFVANAVTKIVNPSSVNLDKFDDSNLNIKILPDNLCYVIYTSGSTGKPKGVMLTHYNLINFLYNFNDCFYNKFSSTDNCLSVTNISFDVSVCEIFTPLCFGSTLVLYPKNTLTNIKLLCDILEQNKITFLYLPPNILQDVYSFVKENNYKFFVNKLLVGVEAIKKKDLNNFYELNPDIEIVNGYGPTENTICSTFFRYSYDDDFNGIVPIRISS